MTAVLVAALLVGVAGGVLVARFPADSRWFHFGGGMCLAIGVIGVVAALTGS